MTESVNPPCRTDSVPLVVCVAIALHLIWAFALFWEADVINATGLHTMLVIARESSNAAAIFLTVAIMAILALFIKARRAFCVLLLLPQQAALWVSIVGAVNAIALGQFADGVQRSSLFLLVDQIPIILIALGHTAALLLIAEKRNGG